MPFQIVMCDSKIADDITRMLEELGEPPQVLSTDSPRPLVVHRVMAQMTLVVAGTGHALLAGQRIALSAGYLLILSPGCEHSFAAADGDLELRHWHWCSASFRMPTRCALILPSCV